MFFVRSNMLNKKFKIDYDGFTILINKKKLDYFDLLLLNPYQCIIE